MVLEASWLQLSKGLFTGCPGEWQAPMCTVWEQRFALVLPAAELELEVPCSASEPGPSCLSELLLFLLTLTGN